MKVTFKRPYFIDGYRFVVGDNSDVPERFRDRLPSDAVVEGVKSNGKSSTADKPEAVAVANGDRPKMYAGVPLMFKSDKFATEISREEVLKAAVADFVREAPANTIQTWNDLGQNRRKELMKKRAEELHQPLSA